MERIVLFASGNGSNAEKIILHFKKSIFANVVTVFSNNSNAKVLEIAKNHQRGYPLRIVYYRQIRRCETHRG